MFTVPTLFHSQFDDLFDAFDHLLSDRRSSPLYAGLRGYQPTIPVSVWSNDTAVAVTAEVPGVNTDDLAIEATHDTVTISGARRQPDEATASPTWLINERHGDRFSRTISLPWRIDPDQVEARLANGVLTLALRRADADRPRKIAVAN